MFNFTAPPSWLPALTQPVDWFVFKILGIIILIGLIASAITLTIKGGDGYV